LPPKSGSIFWQTLYVIMGNSACHASMAFIVTTHVVRRLFPPIRHQV